MLLYQPAKGNTEARPTQEAQGRVQLPLHSHKPKPNRRHTDTLGTQSANG